MKIVDRVCGLIAIALLLVLFAPFPARLVAQAPHSTPDVPKTKSLSREIDALVTNYMNSDSHVPGLAVGVIEISGHDQPVYSAGFYGVINKESGAKPTAETLFEIGSETKVFTATLLAFMVNEGQLKLDDPIQMYLPSSVHVPTYEGQQIKILDLATHRSGLPDTPDNRPNDILIPYTVQDMYAWLN